MYELGLHYSKYYYWKKYDIKKAMEWFKKASALGNIDSMNKLGYYYEYGDNDFKKDEGKALEWYKKALDADPSSVDALYAMGRFYEHGKGGLPKDDSIALDWYKKAADKDCFGAKNAMGRLYHKLKKEADK